jgi:carbamoyltransferase
MGLAAYGEDNPMLYELLSELIHVDGLKLEFCSESRQFRIFQKLRSIQRHKGQPPAACADLARAGQRVFTEVITQYLNNLSNLNISHNLMLSGGCALNSLANGTILRNTPFKQLHVFSAPADDGNAIGAAILAFQEDNPGCRLKGQLPQSPYLGSEMSTESLKRVQEFSHMAGLTAFDPAEAAIRAAALLASGKIIGWVQGRAEFGPRALGNRSILADPRDPDIKSKINGRIKFREDFRPFAPSILHEFGCDYFEEYQESLYMERTLRFKGTVVDTVPGVVHADGTGRLQTIKKEWNPLFHDLVKHFYTLTGVPLILNTSLNIMGRPIIHSVEDALAVFYTTGLDALFIEGLLLLKS